MVEATDAEPNVRFEAMIAYKTNDILDCYTYHRIAKGGKHDSIVGSLQSLLLVTAEALWAYHPHLLVVDEQIPIDACDGIVDEKAVLGLEN